MIIRLNLHSGIKRIVLAGSILIGLSLFLGFAAVQFIISVVADPRIEIGREVIEATAQRFPNAADVQSRLAARLIESEVSEVESHEEISQRAIFHANRAVQLAPRNYEHRVLLSAARELTGDLPAAEKDLRSALSLAPSQNSLHWRLANLLIRLENTSGALAEFKTATTNNPALLPAALSTVWQLTDGNIEAVKSVVNHDPQAQTILARFLADQSQFSQAVESFRQIDRTLAGKFPESRQLIDRLIAAADYDRADQVWQHLMGERSPSTLIWNSSFEIPLRKDFAQFDWQLTSSKYARVGLTTGLARSGNRSLGIEYQGLETTRLESEIKQLVPVRPNNQYHLECYAKAESLVTADGPRIIITGASSQTVIAETMTVAPGSHDWQILSADFVVPPNLSAVLISVKQAPRFSYAEPTKGTVWFDDFVLLSKISTNSKSIAEK